MNSRSIGFAAIGSGITAILVGRLILSGGLHRFGRLLGDVRIEGERARICVPIASMISLSLGMSILFSRVSRLLR